MLKRIRSLLESAKRVEELEAQLSNAQQTLDSSADRNEVRKDALSRIRLITQCATITSVDDANHLFARIDQIAKDGYAGRPSSTLPDMQAALDWGFRSRRTADELPEPEPAEQWADELIGSFDPDTPAWPPAKVPNQTNSYAVPPWAVGHAADCAIRSSVNSCDCGAGSLDAETSAYAKRAAVWRERAMNLLRDEQQAKRKPTPEEAKGNG